MPTKGASFYSFLKTSTTVLFNELGLVIKKFGLDTFLPPPLGRLWPFLAATGEVGTPLVISLALDVSRSTGLNKAVC